MSKNKIDIGFLEEKENWLLHPRFFPSKVGGKPAWLDLKSIPSSSELTCQKCNNPLIFLCQVYAPFEESDDCFHRTIFVFVCRNGSCCRTNSAENFKVLRCQLPRKNNFYSFMPYEENKHEVFPMEKSVKLCFVCGIKAPSHCSKCKKTYYCSRVHQVLHWKKEHKEQCSSVKENSMENLSDFTVKNPESSILFKEWELLVDEEVEEQVTPVDENKELQKLTAMLQEKKAGTLNDVSEKEIEQYVRGIPEDKIFKKFNKRISQNPDQVLRYDKGGCPLWITATTENIVIPKCKYCNGDRQFEMQIMPQLLNFINVGTDVNSIDWGVLVIYSCKESCNDGPSYKEEYIIKQDLTN